MIKLYRKFENYSNGVSRIFVNEKDEYAEIYHLNDGGYGVYKCDKRGFQQSDIRFVRTYKEAKQQLQYII